MPIQFKKLSLIHIVILLRCFSIAIQIALIAFVNLLLDYDLPWFSLLILITIEIFFNIICFVSSRSFTGDQKNHLFIQLIADVCFLGCLLYFSGGATNAFVSLLLIPIAIAAVTLSVKQLATISLLALATYTFLLWLLPMHVMHGNMQGHFIGMWINFIFSAAVITLVIARMARTISLRETTIANYREEQLKQEKIIAVGLASAQVTHDIATPLASIRLLTDELLEDNPTSPALVELDKQVERCSKNIHTFRAFSLNVSNEKTLPLSIATLFEQLRHHSALYYPNTHIDFVMSPDDPLIAEQVKINADYSLTPAILNVVSNAINASNKNGAQGITITGKFNDDFLHIIVRDFGKGFSKKQFEQLGAAPVKSDQGLGMAIFLSNATFERLGGKLILHNHHEIGAEVTISLPRIATT